MNKMKLTFSQARKRKEQSFTKVCEAISGACIAMAFLLALTCIAHNW